MNKFPLLFLLLILSCSTPRTSINSPLSNDWTSLLDKELSQWEVFIGVPHESVDLPTDHPKSSDGKTGTPLGLNNDPKNVFTTQINEDNELELYITGEIFGALSSKNSYENYHFRCEFKWGEKKWQPRLNAKRDNGILYHCTGEHGAFWNVWMRCLELQVQEGDFGDFHPLAGAIADFKVKKVPNTEKDYIFDLEGTTQSAAYMPDFEVGRVIKSENHEKAHGEWNMLEVYTIGNRAVHVINGKVVSALSNARYKEGDQEFPLTHGKIQLQSEAAESYYKNIAIRKITDFPQALKVAAGFED